VLRAATLNSCRSDTGLPILRDNPRVPWALRDLCNPWTWAYSLDPSRLQYLKLSHYS